MGCRRFSSDLAYRNSQVLHELLHLLQRLALGFREEEEDVRGAKDLDDVSRSSKYHVEDL